MNVLRKLALVWMIAWLPLSGVVAVTMPFCMQGIMGMAAMQHAVGFGAEESAAESADSSRTPCHQKSSAGEDAPMCEHCDLCHLAGALAPPTLPSTHSGVPPESPVDLSRADFTSFFPEPLPRPPVLSGD